MSLLQAFILALVQGLTEFLPISSSAHLVLLPWLLGWNEHGLLFDVVTNTGTLLAAVVFFRRELALSLGLAAPAEGAESRIGSPRLAAKLLLATLPAVLCGLLFYDFLAGVARSPAVIATTSVVFGLLLWWADRRGRRQRQMEDLGWFEALGIGLAQALALVPGTSRSGVTMSLGLGLGLKRGEAARFSFLLAIPVGLLALAKQLLDLFLAPKVEIEMLPLMVGFGVSAITAYLTIGGLLRWLERQTMAPFVVYRVLLGALVGALICCI